MIACHSVSPVRLHATYSPQASARQDRMGSSSNSAGLCSSAALRSTTGAVIGSWTCPLGGGSANPSRDMLSADVAGGACSATTSSPTFSCEARLCNASADGAVSDRAAEGGGGTRVAVTGMGAVWAIGSLSGGSRWTRSQLISSFCLPSHLPSINTASNSMKIHGGVPDLPGVAEVDRTSRIVPLYARPVALVVV